MNKLIISSSLLVFLSVGAESNQIDAQLTINCQDLDTITVTQVNVHDRFIQIMQGYLDPSGFWLKGGLGVFNKNSKLPDSVSPSLHFEHVDWPNKLVLIEPGQVFVSKFKLSDFFAMQGFEVARIHYRSYLDVTIDGTEVPTVIESNRIIVEEECRNQ